MTTTDTIDRRFFGHPRGLSTLFFTEMWERFSFYGMKAFLLYFMLAKVDEGGLEFSKEKAGIIMGVYTASVYLMTLPGGWIADRFLGQRKAVLFGGVSIMTGHIFLAAPAITTFYAGLVFVILGTGLLKPSISTMVGRLYPAGDHRRDAGFSIFYMGINLGAFLAPLACGYLAQGEGFKSLLTSIHLSPLSSWHFGFAAAAVGMFFGLVQYVLTSRHLGDAGLRPVPAANPAEAAKHRRTLVLVLAAVFGLPALVALLHSTGVIEITADLVGKAALALLIIMSVAFFTVLFTIGKWSAAEFRRLVLIAVLFVAAAIFWTCFEQAGTTFSLFAQESTRTKLLSFAFPPSWFQSLNSFFVIALAAVFAVLWVKLGKREPSDTFKFAMGLALVAGGLLVMVMAASLASGGARVSPLWLCAVYFIHTCGELCLSPVGLSSMTKLAPERVGGMMMGAWFLAAAIGNYAAGRTAGIAASHPMVSVMTVLAIIPAVAAVVMFLLVRPMRRMMGVSRTPSAADAASAA